MRYCFFEEAGDKSGPRKGNTDYVGIIHNFLLNNKIDHPAGNVNRFDDILIS